MTVKRFGASVQDVLKLSECRPQGVHMLDRYPVEDLGLEHLQKLIDANAPEGQTLEYKEQPFENNDEGNVKLLRTVVAFANTDGGHLIIGMRAGDQNSPPSIVPFPIDGGTIDSFQLMMQQKIISNVEPRIPSFRVRAISCNGDYVCIVRVEKSFAGPHRLEFKTKKSFYIRIGASTIEPTIDQLRRMFVSGTLLEIGRAHV